MLRFFTAYGLVAALLCPAGAVAALPEAWTHLERKCSTRLHALGIDDFVLPSGEGREWLDEQLKDLARRLQNPATPVAERERIRSDVARLLFPLLYRTLLRRYGSVLPDDEFAFDVVQDAVTRFVGAVESRAYDPDYPVRAFTFAFRGLRWDLRQHFRDRRRLSGTVVAGSESTDGLESLLPVREAVLTVFAELPSEDREILLARADKTPLERLASMHGVVEGTIIARTKNALGALRTGLARYRPPRPLAAPSDRQCERLASLSGRQLIRLVGIFRSTEHLQAGNDVEERAESELSVHPHWSTALGNRVLWSKLAPLVERHNRWAGEDPARRPLLIAPTPKTRDPEFRDVFVKLLESDRASALAVLREQFSDLANDGGARFIDAVRETHGKTWLPRIRIETIESLLAVVGHLSVENRQALREKLEPHLSDPAVARQLDMWPISETQRTAAGHMFDALCELVEAHNRAVAAKGAPHLALSIGELAYAEHTVDALRRISEIPAELGRRPGRWGLPRPARVRPPPRVRFVLPEPVVAVTQPSRQGNALPEPGLRLPLVATTREALFESAATYENDFRVLRDGEVPTALWIRAGFLVAEGDPATMKDRLTALFALLPRVDVDGALNGGSWRDGRPVVTIGRLVALALALGVELDRIRPIVERLLALDQERPVADDASRKHWFLQALVDSVWLRPERLDSGPAASELRGRLRALLATPGLEPEKSYPGRYLVAFSKDR